MTKDKTKTASIFAMHALDPANFLGFQSRLTAVNELATGLSATITNSILSTSYNNALIAQSSILKSATSSIERLCLVESKASEFMASVAPISASLAGIGLASANASRLFEVGSIVKDQLLATQKISSICLDSLQDQQGYLANAMKSIDDATSLATYRSVVDSEKLINTGLSSMIESLPTYPTELKLPSLEFIYAVGKTSPQEISEHQHKLDSLLKAIDPSLVEYRRGCWTTFNARRPDYIGQASSSMRRLVDNVFRILAPNRIVVNTKFFKDSPKARDDKGNPTRRARIYCITNFENNRAEHLERLAEGFLSSYDNLSAWDHMPLKKHDFVEGALIAIEGHLISLLSEYENE